jgi:hypothetical protein
MKHLIFLVGFQRSGTTWVQKILGAHPNIGTAQESHVFDQFVGPAVRYWEKIVAVDMGRGGVGLPAYLTREEFDDLGRELVEHVLSRSDEYRNKPIFLEKTPDHVRYIDVIHQLFPQAKFVMMVRRPEDVVESMLAAGKDWGRHWASKSVCRASWRWRRAIKEGMAQLEQVPADKKLLIRYEDMKRDPQAVTRRMLEFINVDASPEIAAHLCESPIELNRYGYFASVNGQTVREPKAFRRDRKEKLNGLQNLMIRLISRDHARQFGY